MEHINKIELAGIVGTLKETRLDEKNRNIRFTLAVNESAGNVVTTTWFSCTYWGEHIISKGQEIHIKGRMISNRYADAEGNEKTFYEVRVSSIL